MKHNLKKRRIWITGASSGIGKALAEQCLALGSEVALSARRGELLTDILQANGNNGLVVPFDVTDRQAFLDAAANIRSEWGYVDILILNAGGSTDNQSGHFDSANFEAMMTLNFFSMIYGIEAGLPLLRQSQHPHLVGMSSLAAYGGLPTSMAYSASKAASRNMLQGLRIDLLKENIPVSIICPGFVKTPLTDKNKFPMPMLMSTEKAVSHILKGIQRYQEEIHFPKLLSFSTKLFSSLPSKIYTYVLGKITAGF